MGVVYLGYDRELDRSVAIKLLRARGAKPVVLDKDERYWRETLDGIDSFESGAAVAAHAEEMRLARIEGPL